MLTTNPEALMEEWNSPIYAFFSIPEIMYIDGCRAHQFKCLAKRCKHNVRCFLDTQDAKSTGNLRWHVKHCGGEDVMKTIDKAKSITCAQEGVKHYAANGSINAAFGRKVKGKVNYFTNNIPRQKSSRSSQPFLPLCLC